MMCSKVLVSSSDNGQYYIGIMSGTSADGIDLALVQFEENSHHLVASYFQAYNKTTQNLITSLYTPSDNEIDRMGELDKLLAKEFASAINAFLIQQNLSSASIIAIGNHGQTIRHRPTSNAPFTLQIGCNQTLACLTGIRVIGKFRDKDIALGGQGAPLVPAFHKALFSATKRNVCAVNIGGISNITFLPKDHKQNICGFDTGPGNALLDDWYRKHHEDCPHGIDIDGKWGLTGKVNKQLLTNMLDDPYFSMPTPKSTGREYFHLDWLKTINHIDQVSPADVQATLLALTCKSIAHDLDKLCSNAEVILCGGGANNPELVKQLKKLLPEHCITTAEKKGVDNDSLEALVFAWLAFAFDNKIPGNLPEVTGAKSNCILGISFTP
ncbi:anhydro-N-acetylmuramic acid kinase [Thalassotalea psychrophila]|uniref:Anhydro-N-acetylmuramic acid kinase n=1 Tax=Thalassotalea psychrophila TaxID=3065647 RepID=A0ABY9TSF9_9GAMM|nr:anhydro-N-acetylmuramic acid kinase [Colwelliaceae bacterium SQ149]